METIFGIPTDNLLFALLILAGIILIITSVAAIRYPLAFRLGLRNLPRRKSQTSLIVVGLALSTLIITSALGIGDTVDYSVKSGVYENLGSIDEQIGTTKIESSGGFSFTGSAQAETAASDPWFAASSAADVAALVDNVTLDASVPAILQTLPVANSDTNLSEAAVEIRGLGQIDGNGFAALEGLADLESSQALINASLATALDASTGDNLLLIKGMPTAFEVAGIVPDGELAGATPAVILTLERAQSFFGQNGMITAIFVSNAGDAESGAALSESVTTALGTVASGLVVNPIKADQLESAASSAETITTLFVTFGTFSIVSGILLIFLIFSVLAAERKSELGMSRAIGLQRSDLIAQFVTEGLAYNLIAAAVGAALGVGAAILLAQSITQLVGGSLEIVARVSPRSILIGYTLGVVITFITVSLSAVRISKINIIAAIRDLNLPVPPRLPQWTLFLHPFTVWKAAIQKAGQGNIKEAARLFLFAGPKAVLNFWAGLFARGPILLVLGYAFAYAGVNFAKMAGVYGLGVSLFLIGLGQLARWWKLPERIAYTLVGVSLILYWSLPTRDIGALAELEGNPGDFFISGMFLVAGAIIVFLYNADMLLNLFAGLLSRLGRLLPVARVSIAYPVSAKGRTATTLAMFSLIIFTLVSTATITNTFSNFLDVEGGSGGYDILVQTNPFNPVPAEDFSAKVDQLVADGTMVEPLAFSASAFAPVEAQSPDMPAPQPYAIQGVDEAFIASQQLKLAGIANGYETPEQVWAAIEADPSLVIVDGFSLDSTGAPGWSRNEEAFYISSVKSSDTRFDPINIQITARDGSVQEMTVIASLSNAPSFYGALMNMEAAQNLGYGNANRYFLRLPEGADVLATANALEAAFPRAGLQTSLLKQVIEASQASTKSVFYLIQGFVGLGLLIGIAALGVVTIRAVVERRQQIGVLRAIGFQRDMVQKVFLFENLFIGGLGTLIGYALALTFAYNLYLQVASDQGLDFLPPWAQLIGIGIAILVATLIMGWLPARSTAKVVIAEALRYE
jgi:putative ABC transport system permease protein